MGSRPAEIAVAIRLEKQNRRKRLSGYCEEARSGSTGQFPLAKNLFTALASAEASQGLNKHPACVSKLVSESIKSML
jgi:hypothetical protein